MNPGNFLGTGWRFPPTFNLNGSQTSMVSAEDDIRESLSILFATTPGERIMQPGYGCDLRALVFAEIDASTLTAIQDMITQAVRHYEPRIDLNSVHIDDSQAENGLLQLTLNYTVLSTNTRSNMVYPFYFLEGTSLSD
ncbi:MAG: hypothetical protein RIR00_2015 [Pseudomonadota bacterium]|jgi:phage baseplate assembly protein W